VASGSLRELETHLVIIQRLGYVQNMAADSALHRTDELSKMLYKMRKRVLANISAADLATQDRRNKSSELA
jgi:four helix bundle protein